MLNKVLSITTSPSECSVSVNTSVEAIQVMGYEMSFIVSIPSILDLLPSILTFFDSTASGYGIVLCAANGKFRHGQDDQFCSERPGADG